MAEPQSDVKKERVFGATLAKRLELLGLDRSQVLELVEYGSGQSKQLKAWLNAYNQHVTKGTVRYETICDIAEVSYFEFYGAISALYQHIQKDDALGHVSKILPDVVEATGRQALSADGTKEREMVLKMAGMPGLQGGGININNNISNQLTAIQANVPKFVEGQQRLGGVISQITEANIARALPPAETSDFIEVEVQQEENVHVVR